MPRICNVLKLTLYHSFNIWSLQWWSTCTFYHLATIWHNATYYTEKAGNIVIAVAGSLSASLVIGICFEQSVVKSSWHSSSTANNQYSIQFYHQNSINAINAITNASLFSIYSRKVNRWVCNTFIARVASLALITQEILISLAPVEFD